jgi:hypothetical protein
MEKMKFKCTLLSDVIISHSSSKEGNQFSLAFIPGNNFLGIVASSIYKKVNALDVFHSGKVRFGDANPSIEGRCRGLRVPNVMFYPKLKKASEECYIHYLIPNPDADEIKGLQLKQCREGFYAFAESKGTPIDFDKNFAIKSALTRYQAQTASGQMLADPVSKITDVDIPKREEMQHQVFISYSRRDEEAVKSIKAILEEFGIPYWIDKEGIFSGENYKEVIVDAIEVAKVVIFVSSVNSNASINVIRELGYAVQQRKTIIPVLLDDAQYAKSIRLDIADIDQIEFKDTEQAKKKLVASLAYSLEL